MKKLIIILMGIWIFTSCIAPNPENSLSVEERDIYMSNYTAVAKFSAYRTYSIVDSVYYYVQSGNSYADGRQRLSDDITVLQTIEAEMTKMNYTKVDFAANPDVVVDVSRISVTSTQTGVYYPSYNSYYGYGYGYGYGGYAVAYSYQKTQMSLNIDMFDAKNLTPDNKFQNVWSGVILGDLSNNSPNLQNRLNTGIKTIFSQSSYLKDGK